MKEHLGRCAESLRKAVRHLANSSGTPQEKLTCMYNDTGFRSIYEGDFPKGSLRNGFLTIVGPLVKTSEPQVAVNIAAMSDEEARKVIEQIGCLSEAAAYALGRQNGFA